MAETNRPDRNKDSMSPGSRTTGGGAFAGDATRIDPVSEDRYWQSNFSSRPYVTTDSTYRDYAPAYRYGYERYASYHGKRFDEVESDFGRNWDAVKGDSRLTWEKAKHATRDAFERVSNAIERAMPGDSDRDGR